jgi:hypothetical protein
MENFPPWDFEIEIRPSRSTPWCGPLVDHVFAAARWPSWVVVDDSNANRVLANVDKLAECKYVYPITRVDRIRIDLPPLWGYHKPNNAQILRVAEVLDRNAEAARELLARACDGPPRSIADLKFELSFRDHVVTVEGRDLVETPADIIGRWTAVYYTGDGVGYLTKPTTEEAAKARLMPMLAPTIDRVRAEVDALPPRREENRAMYARHRLHEVIEECYGRRQLVDRSMWAKK